MKLFSWILLYESILCKKFFSHGASRLIQSSIICIFMTILFPSTANGFDIVFRLDDPTLEKSNFTDRIVNLFAQKEVPLSIAFVACDNKECPFTSIDSATINKLNAGPFEICIHGMNHHKHGNSCGEFAQISREETRRRLNLAINVLQPYSSNQIKTFIPPHNAIDKVSLFEIKKSCSIVSSDMFLKSPMKGIDYYPETLGHMMDNRSVWDAASEVIHEKHGKKDICVVMFHRYDLKNEDDWNALSELLDYCNHQNDIKLYTFSSLQESGNHSTWRRLKANQLDSGLKKAFLKKGVLYPTWICYLTHIINAFLYALLPLVFLFLIRVQRKHISMSCRLSFVLISVISFISAYLHWFGPLKLLALVLLFCLVTSMFIIFLNKKIRTIPYKLIEKK